MASLRRPLRWWAAWPVISALAAWRAPGASAVPAEGCAAATEAQLKGTADGQWNDRDAAQLFSVELASAMAALSTLARCTWIPGYGATPLTNCGEPCTFAGLEIEEDGRHETMPDLAHGVYAVGFRRAASATLAQVASLPERGFLVVFRGTLMTNESAPGENDALETWDYEGCVGCKVHAGHQARWRSLQRPLFAHLDALGCTPGDSIFVTGHSEAAAMATLAMANLQARGGYNVLLSYTFGASRVGNNDFAVFFDSLFGRHVSVFRLTHGSDVYPRLPRRSAGFADVGHQVWYPWSTSTDYVICGGARADPSCGTDGLPFACTVPPSLDGPHCRFPLAPAITSHGFCLQGALGGKVRDVADLQIQANLACLRWFKGKEVPITIDIPTSDQEAAPAASGDRSQVAHVAQQVAQHAAQEPTASAGNGNWGQCFARNPKRMPTFLASVDATQEASAYVCQARCATSAGCTFFAFRSRGQLCYLATGEVSDEDGFGWVVGPSSCPRDGTATWTQKADVAAAAHSASQDVKARDDAWTAVVIICFLGFGVLVSASLCANSPIRRRRLPFDEQDPEEAPLSAPPDEFSREMVRAKLPELSDCEGEDAYRGEEEFQE